MFRLSVYRLAGNRDAKKSPGNFRKLDVAVLDAGPANRFDYAGTIPLQWWRLDGAGHTVPSQAVIVSPNPLTGIQNRDIEFAEVAWAFFASRLPANR